MAAAGRHRGGTRRRCGRCSPSRSSTRADADGALNVFADRPNAFDDESTETAAILAAFAPVALRARVRRRTADQLQQGLATNREIGAAVGILMATHSISQDEAFDLLRKASQRLNRKLRDIATGIVRGRRGRPRLAAFST